MCAELAEMIDSGLVGEVSRGEKMLYSGTDPESYITEYTLIYEDHLEVQLDTRDDAALRDHRQERLTDYSQVDILAFRYKFVNFRAKRGCRP